MNIEINNIAIERMYEQFTTTVELLIHFNIASNNGISTDKIKSI